MEFLPQEVLQHILLHVDEADLLSCYQVCGDWRAALQETRGAEVKRESVLLQLQGMIQRGPIFMHVERGLRGIRRRGLQLETSVELFRFLNGICGRYWRGPRSQVTATHWATLPKFSTQLLANFLKQQGMPAERADFCCRALSSVVPEGKAISGDAGVAFVTPAFAVVIAFTQIL